MKVKKFIKGIMGLGAMAGVAYLAFKVGESNGEINERFRQKYGDDDLRFDDDEDEFSFYGTMDEPDDECLAPDDEQNADDPDEDDDYDPLEDYRCDEWGKFGCEGSDYRFTNPDLKFTRIRNLDTLEFSTAVICKALFTIMDDVIVSNVKLRNQLGYNIKDSEKLLSIFEKAGYVSEKDENNIRKVYISDMTLEDLL